MNEKVTEKRWSTWKSLACLLFFLIGCATGAGQPHMQAALDALSTAKSELQAAESNKGGHRERAINLVNEAMTEVQAGIDFAAARH